MGAEAKKAKRCIVRLAVDQHEVGPEVAVAAVLPLADESMVAEPLRQWLVSGQQGERIGEHAMERRPERTGFDAPKVSFELACAPNRPHRYADRP
jgi:hypothetical protein